jgi:hypothetical protein
MENKKVYTEMAALVSSDVSIRIPGGSEEPCLFVLRKDTPYEVTVSFLKGNPFHCHHGLNSIVAALIMDIRDLQEEVRQLKAAKAGDDTPTLT